MSSRPPVCKTLWLLSLTPSEKTFRVASGGSIPNWPLNYAGYALESTTNLARPTVWAAINSAQGDHERHVRASPRCGSHSSYGVFPITMAVTKIFHAE
jgi:hypothetical protein